METFCVWFKQTILLIKTFGGPFESLNEMDKKIINFVLNDDIFHADDDKIKFETANESRFSTS